MQTVALGPNIVIHQDEEVFLFILWMINSNRVLPASLSEWVPFETLSRMNDWCKDKFSKNGLIERIRASEVEMVEAEEQVHLWSKTFV